MLKHHYGKLGGGLLLLAIWLVFECSISWFAFCNQIQNQSANYQATKENICVFRGPLLSIVRAMIDWWQSTFDKPDAYVALFTAFLVISTVALWWSTRRLWKAGEEQFAAAHRPWVGVVGLPEIVNNLHFDGIAGAVTAEVRLTIKNTGQSPAFNTVMIDGCLLIGHPRRDPRGYVAVPDLEMAARIIEANAGILIVPGDPIDWPIRDLRIENLDPGQAPVRVWLRGYFAYRDGLTAYTPPTFCSLSNFSGKGTFNLSD